MLLERWQNFSKKDQLGHIASEILRARLVKNINIQVIRAILEKAIGFVDLSLGDSKWRDNPLPLLFLRNELSKAYLGDATALENSYKIL